MNPEAEMLFARAWGERLSDGPNSTARSIRTALRALEPDLRRQGGWQAPRTFPDAALIGDTETPLYWALELNDDEVHLPWLCRFDRRAAYLSVLDGLELGLADAWRFERPTFDARLPGYWRVRGGFPPAELDFPDPLARETRRYERWRMPDGSSWVATPTLELALEYGLEVDVDEAWLWQRHRRVLRGFGQRCQEARRTLESVLEGPADPEAVQEAIRALKPVYGATLGGFLAHVALDAERRPRAHQPPWYRPDWRHAIIAKTRANVFRAMWRVRPFARIAKTVNDAFYVISNEPAARLAERAQLRPDFWRPMTYPLAEALDGRRISLKRLRAYVRRVS